ncbi:MAG: hypothetical protein C5B51_09270 [Terriglobia bacterium]|nr:MAG: hypothetical protein C5B51_09270 [Terriglobia bacterium]
MAAPGLAPIRKRRKRRTRQLPLWPFGVLLLIASVTTLVWLILGRITRPSAQNLAGYIDSSITLREEHVRFYNSAVQPAVEQDFAAAAAMARRGDSGNALSALEKISRTVSLPAVYNDLGVLYLKQHDDGHARAAFREALSRDSDYPQTRANLADHEEILNSAPPVTQEAEPNDTHLMANVVALGRPFGAEVATAEDIDCFRFKAPPAPRDILAVEVQNLSATLIPSLGVFDGTDRFLGWSQAAQQPGASLSARFSPQPNSTLVVHVWGSQKSTGKYRTVVRALKAFDAYEPNDDLPGSRPLTIGQSIEANIMDAADTDFYSFAAPESGIARVEIRNRSTTLIPALTTYSPDHHTSGFGPEVKTAGSNLIHTFQVKPKQTYYIQVWSRSNTAGAYSLTIQ